MGVIGITTNTSDTSADEPPVWVDILEPGLDLVFVGFNPSLVAWRTGHYYANPGNRFYHLLWESGLTPRLLGPAEDRTLPAYGIGVTDLVGRPSAGIDDLPREEFVAGANPTLARLRAAAPRAVCCNGLGVHRALVGRSASGLGRQPHGLPDLPSAALFVVPSSSGRCNGRAAERLLAWRDVAAFLGRHPAPEIVASGRAMARGRVGADGSPHLGRLRGPGQGAILPEYQTGPDGDPSGPSHAYHGRRQRRAEGPSRGL